MALPDHCIDLVTDVGPKACPECQQDRDEYVACLETVLAGEDNHLQGIDAVIRFKDCWHPVPGAYMSAFWLARALNYFDQGDDR